MNGVSVSLLVIAGIGRYFPGGCLIFIVDRIEGSLEYLGDDHLRGIPGNLAKWTR